MDDHLADDCPGSDDTDEHATVDRMYLLTYTLGIIYCTRLLTANIQQAAIPAYLQRVKRKKHDREQYAQRESQRHSRRHAHRHAQRGGGVVSGDLEENLLQEEKSGPESDHAEDIITAIEEQFELGDYDITMDLYEDYLEMVIQFGYVTLFSAAFSVAPVLAYLNNYIQIRVDGWKITSLSRRPFPQAASDIGIWKFVIEFMSIVSILTNVYLVVFVSTMLHDFKFTEKIIIFAIADHVLLVVKVFLRTLIEDIPEEIKIQLKRQDVIMDKVIKNTRDDTLKIREYLGKNRRARFQRLHPKHKFIYLNDFDFVRINSERPPDLEWDAFSWERPSRDTTPTSDMPQEALRTPLLADLMNDGWEAEEPSYPSSPPGVRSRTRVPVE